MLQRVPLHNLLLPIPINNCIQTLEYPSAHQIPHALLLDPEPLYLIVDVKEQRVVARRIVARPDQETARSRLDQQINRLVLGAVRVEPREDCVGIDAVVKVLDELAEYHSLLAGTMGSDPQPAVAHVVVHEEDVALLEG